MSSGDLEPDLFVVAVASSAGGLAALSTLLSTLPADFPGAILIAQHLDPRRKSLMAEILDKRTALAVKQAEDGDHLVPGHVYVAPPDYHLTVTAPGKIALEHTEKVGYLRPRADLLFHSVARFYGSKAIAVVLSGTGRDGSLGVQRIKELGGRSIAQDKEGCQFPAMPQAAIATGHIDYIVPVSDIAQHLERLTRRSS